MASTFDISEVSKHNNPEDLWIVVHNDVFDVTKFSEIHPGGKRVLFQVGGMDATEKFDQFHNKDVLKKYSHLKVENPMEQGTKSSKEPKDMVHKQLESSLTSPLPSPTITKYPISFPESISMPSPSEASYPKDQQLQYLNKVASGDLLPPGFFGDQNPYGDPSWYQGWFSPYYNKSHLAFRASVREFVEREVIPFCHEWDEARAIPPELYEKSSQAGWLPLAIGTPFPTEFVPEIQIPGSVKPEEYDAFHELIVFDELARCGSGGVLWAISGGLAIGLPPIINFGSRYLKDKVARLCLLGKKIICLAVTEPSAGSDVANITTEAKLTEDKRHYIVNGEKKWITNGVFADYFTVAVRTGGPGMAGVSLLLIERDMPGVKTTQMKCQGVWPSGTSYVTFEDVKVPVENLIGKENYGFKYIMYNFNHERWLACVGAIRFSRVCLEESLKYALKRKTFGKQLIDHPVIRLKMAHMARQIEATQAWLELITYQMMKMSPAQQQRLGGSIALCKAQCTQTFEFCAREASQIFGGLAYTRGGQGEKVERLYREVRAYAIPAGSEEIMLDLGIREAMKKAKL